MLFVPEVAWAKCSDDRDMVLEQSETIVNNVSRGAILDSVVKSPDSIVVVARPLSRAKFDSSVGAKYRGQPVVRPEWVVDSLANRRLLPLDEYQYSFDEKKPEPTKEPEKLEASDPHKADQRLVGFLSMGTRSEKGRMDEFANNAKVVERFEEAIKIYEVMQFFDKNNVFRIKNYRLAISAIESLDKALTSAQDLQRFGLDRGGIAQHVEEVLQTGTFSKLETLKQQEKGDERYQLMTQFKKIYGVGDTTAYRFVKAGYKSIQDIVHDQAMYASLTDAQKLGILHFDEWNERIPRTEVEKHYNFVVREAKEIDKNLKVMLMGSYRRGAETSGDIDLIVYTEEVNEASQVHENLYKLTRRLQESGFIVCSMTEVSPAMHKFNGGCKLPEAQICRRLDIIGIPHAELGAATIYFVGNDIFNRCLRLLARIKGYHLSNKGLFLAADKSLVESFDERRILHTLGLDWVEYKHRNI
ncbi:hypothetical protein KL935_000341 [Ogataea polymorpha]|nr:hypothetical protein KL935_000341 [Ogataea polymorpha]